MTIMSVSAPRINSGFSIQSILGDIDNQKQNSENSENKGSKRKNSEDESDECNTCCLNHTESGRIDTPNSRLHFGTFDGLANGNILRKLHYSHYGHYLSHEYMSRTQEDFRNFWHTGSEDGSNPFYLPLSLRHNYQPRAQATNPDFIFSHLRKPKRVRTAFSPSQLLRLEHAFEKNHYVVGQERKELAAGLALTETQVKVWFQNRRTKHKRIKAEDEMTRSLARSLDERDTNEHEQYNSSDDESDIEV